jgi:hypothetical protein
VIPFAASFGGRIPLILKVPSDQSILPAMDEMFREVISKNEYSCDYSGIVMPLQPHPK